MNSNRGNKRKLSNDGKRAAHVKFDGKTIALGTFPDEDADIICKRAKVLTKSWRDIYPKPSVEWVKRSLERSGIRLVNDRPGRQPSDRQPDKQNKKGPILPNGPRESHDSMQKGPFSFSSFVEREGKSVKSQVQSTSVLPSSNLPQSISKTVTNSCIDSVSNISEGGSTSSKGVFPQGSLFSSLASSHHSIAKTTPKEQGSSLRTLSLSPNYENTSNLRATQLTLNGYTSLRDLHLVTEVNRVNQYSSRDKVTVSQESRTKNIGADSIVADQEEKIHTLGDLGDIDIEDTYIMLARHHMNLINEIEETSTLMDAYRDERNRRKIRQLHEKGSEETGPDTYASG